MKFNFLIKFEFKRSSRTS